MAKRKINYNEGTCFLVPLRNKGFARGIVARMDGKGQIFGYFFGPKIESFDNVNNFENLNYKDSVLVGMFGDLGLLNKEWKILDTLPNWNKDDWPMPQFIRLDENANRAWLVYYNEKDLSINKEEEES